MVAQLVNQLAQLNHVVKALLEEVQLEDQNHLVQSNLAVVDLLVVDL